MVTLSKMASDRYSWHIEFGDSNSFNAPKTIKIEDKIGTQVVSYIKDGECAESLIKKVKEDHNIQGDFLLHDMQNHVLKSKSIISSNILFGGDISKSHIMISLD